MAKKRKNITRKRVQDMEGRSYVPAVEVRPEPDDGPLNTDGLTIRQRAFVDALVGPAQGNATKAAQMAGYAAENRVALASTAWENLRKPQIQEAIAHSLAAKRLTPEWAKNSLAELASSSMANFVSVDVQGNLTVDWQKAAAAGAIGQIKEINEEVIKGGDGDGPAVIRRKIKLYDRVQAVGMLLKLFGLLSDGSDNSKDDVEVRVRRVNRNADGHAS